MVSRYFAAVAVLTIGAFAAPAWPPTPGEKPAARTDACGDPLPAHALACIGTTRWGQRAVSRLTYSRDGKVLAAGWHHDGAFTWDANTGKRLSRLPIDPASNEIVAVSADCRLVALASPDTAAITLRDALSGKERGTILTVTERVSDLILSPDGKFLATRHDRNPGPNVEFVVRIWDTARSTKLWHFPGCSVAFDADNKTVLVGSDKRVRIFDLATGKETRRIDGAADQIALSGDGKTLATRGGTTIRIIDLASGEERRRIATPDHEFDSRSDSLALSQGGQMAALGGAGFLIAWDTTTGKECFRAPSQPQVAGVVFRPGTHVLTWGADDSRIRHWDLAAGKEILPCPGHRNALYPLAFTPDSKMLVSAGRDGSIQYLNLDNGDEKLVQPPPATEKAPSSYADFREVAYSADGKWFAITEWHGKQVSLIDAATGKFVRALRGAVSCTLPVFSPDGKLLACVGDSSNRYGLCIWDIVTGKLICSIETPRGQVICLAFSPDSKALASAGDAIRLWDVATGKRIRRLCDGGATNVLAFAPDGKTLAASWNEVFVMNVESREEIYTLADIGYHATFAISPDGKVIATGGDDRIVHLWDMGTGSELARLPGHSEKVHSLVPKIVNPKQSWHRLPWLL